MVNYVRLEFRNKNKWKGDRGFMQLPWRNDIMLAWE